MSRPADEGLPAPWAKVTAGVNSRAIVANAAVADNLRMDDSPCGHQRVRKTPVPARVGAIQFGEQCNLRKLIEFDDDTFDKLKQLGRDRMATLQELADEAFADLLREARYSDRPEGCAAQERKTSGCSKARPCSTEGRTQAGPRSAEAYSTPTLLRRRVGKRNLQSRPADP